MTSHPITPQGSAVRAARAEELRGLTPDELLVNVCVLASLGEGHAENVRWFDAHCGEIRRRCAEREAQTAPSTVYGLWSSFGDPSSTLEGLYRSMGDARGALDEYLREDPELYQWKRSEKEPDCWVDGTGGYSSVWISPVEVEGSSQDAQAQEGESNE